MNLYEFKEVKEIRGRYLVLAKNLDIAWDKLSAHYKLSLKSAKKSYTLTNQQEGNGKSIFHIDLGIRLLV